MTEIWKAIPEYEGLYDASTAGRIRSLVRPRNGEAQLRSAPRLLKPVCSRGRHYPHVTLYREGSSKTHPLHRIIALTFHGPRPTGREVRHLDGDTLNPAAKNLRYGTAAENTADKVAHGTVARGERVGGAQLTERDAIDILRLYRAHSRTFGGKALAARFGVEPSTVSLLVNGVTWRHIDRNNLPPLPVRAQRSDATRPPEPTRADPYVWRDPWAAIEAVKSMKPLREALDMERAAYAAADAERRVLWARLEGRELAPSEAHRRTP